MSVMQKIAEIEDEMARTQKNKATAKHLGLLKAKLAKLKAEVIASGTKSKGKAGEGFDVTKSGDARVGLVGFPSVGKSTLLTKLTGTTSEVAAYEFTTLTCIPGTINYKGAKIQMLDLPGIIEGAKDGKGRGRQVIGTARTCNVILIVLDAAKEMTARRKIEEELEGFGLRLNKQPPDIDFIRRDKGGVSIRSPFAQEHIDIEVARAICSEYRCHNAEIVIRKSNATVDELIDVIEGNRVYIPCLYVINKIDAISIEELDIISSLPYFVPISAKDEWNMDLLLEAIWTSCNMTRAYTKPKGQVPDYDEPVILRKDNPTVEDFCNKIHRGIMRDFKYAWVWGTSVKHQPQRVGKEHLIHDEDVVQIVKNI